MEPENFEPAPFITIKQSFAKNNTITIKGGVRTGKWSDSFSGACSEQRFTQIQEGAIVFTQDAGSCGDGSPVTVVTHS
jgi:hypothetical protein